MGDPAVGAGSRGARVEALRGVVAVGVDRGRGRAQRFQDRARAVGALVDVEADGAGVGRADQFGERRDVFDGFADGRRGRRFGDQLGARFFDFGDLTRVRAFAVDGFVVGVAGEVGDPAVGAGSRGARVEALRGVVAVGVDRGRGRAQRFQDRARAVGALVDVEADGAGVGRADQFGERRDVFDGFADGRRGRRFGDQLGARFFDFGDLTRVRAFAVDGFVVGVAGEVGDPAVGAGSRGGRVEALRGVVAVGVDRGRGRAQRFQDRARAVGALVDVEADGAGVGRADQFGERRDVFDGFADGRRGRRFGDQLGARFFDFGDLTRVRAFAVDGFVVGVAGEVGDPAVGAGSRGARVEALRGVVAVGVDRGRGRAQRFQDRARAVGALVDVEADGAGVGRADQFGERRDVFDGFADGRRGRRFGDQLGARFFDFGDLTRVRAFAVDGFVVGVAGEVGDPAVGAGSRGARVEALRGVVAVGVDRGRGRAQRFQDRARAVGALVDVEADGAGVGRADQFGERRDVFDGFADGRRGRRFGDQLGARFFDFGDLTRVRAFAVDGFVVGVAGEVGDPAVGAGSRGARVEALRGVVAVGVDRGRGRAQRFQDRARAVGALVDVEGDGAGVGRADQFGERRDVFDGFADGRRGRRFGDQLGARFFDFGDLTRVRAFAVDGFVVGVAGEVGDPAVGAGSRGARVEALRGVVAVGVDRGRGRAQRFQDRARAVGALVDVEADGAGVGRADQFGERRDVFDGFADGRRGRRFGDQLGARFFDFGDLTRVRAFAVDGFVVGVAGVSGRSSGRCRLPGCSCRSPARCSRRWR